MPIPSDPLAPIAARWREEARRALPAAPAELVDEVAEHLARGWQAAVDAGLTTAEADVRAREDLRQWHRAGPITPPTSPWAPLTGWRAELGHALQLVFARPAFSLGAVVLTAIAVAAAGATLAVAYGLLWRPLPYPSGDRLAVVWQVQRGEVGQVSLPDFRDVSGAAVFDASTAISGGRGSLRVGDQIERVNLLEVDAGGFGLLGARPQLGRLLTADDAGQHTVLISDRLWRTRFAASPDILGAPLWVSGQTFTVAGVLAAGVDFELPVAGFFFLEQHDLWAVAGSPGAQGERRDFTGYEGLVRLRPGVTWTEAQAVVDDIGRRLAVDHAATNEGRTFRLAWLQGEVVGRMRQPLLLGGLAALLTFAIALANLVALVSVRLSERQVELAVRHALGAGLLRMRRQLLTEYAVLVCLGTALGVGVARVVVAQLLGSTAAHLPRPDAIRFDAPVIAGIGAVGLVFALVLTLLPLRADGFQDALRKAARVGGGNGRVRHAMIAAQVGLALTLSAGGALLGLSLFRLSTLDPGFVTEGIATARVSAYAADHPQRPDVERFLAAVLAELGRLPGVASTGAGSSLPLSGQASTTSIMAEGQALAPAARPSAAWEVVTPGYFEALGIAVRRGRAFSPSDRQRDAHVTVVNEALAQALFPNQEAIGRRIAVGGDDSSGDWHEIVGVVADVRHHALAEPPMPHVYDLFGQHWERTVYLVTRSTTGQGPALATSIRRAVQAVDPRAPVFDVSTLRDLVRASAAPYRLTTSVAAALAGTGLLLALAGVYAMSAAAAAQRRREMGVRTALGASPHDVFWLIVRESAATIAVGGALGVAGAVAAARILESRAFGVDGADAVLVVPLVAVLLIGAGVAASVPCARSAAAADPLEAMRTD